MPSNKPRVLLLVASLAATPSFAQNLPVKNPPPTGDAAAFVQAVRGEAPGTLAAGDDARLVNAPRVVASIAALRALPAPVAGVDSGHVIVQGYYGPGTPGGGEFGYDATATTGVTGFHVDSIYQLGSGYGPDLAITLSPPDQPGGVQATITCTQWQSIREGNYSGGDPTGGIKTLTIVNPGSGYTKPPTVTFSQDAPTPYQRAILRPYNPAWEDGGRTIVPDAAPGVWRRLHVSPTLVDTDEYGVVYNDPTQADANTARLNAARDVLPLFALAPASGTLSVGPSQLVPQMPSRTGTLVTHGGALWIGDTLILTPEMTLSTNGEHTILTAKDGFAPSKAAQKYLLADAINCVYEEGKVYPSMSTPHPADTYDVNLKGYLTCNGRSGSNNPGVSGVRILAAQGSYIQGTVESIDMGLGPQILTTVPGDTANCLGGAAPGFQLTWAVNTHWERVDVEHLSKEDGLDKDGDAVPACLISGGYANRIDSLSSETNALVCKIDGSPGTSIGAFCGNLDTSGIVIQNAAAGVHVDHIAPYAVSPEATFAVLDRSPDVVNSGLTRGQPVVVPYHEADSYRFGHVEQGPLTAPLVSGDVSVNGLLASTGLPTATTLPGFNNPMPVHTGHAVRGQGVSSETEYASRESLHLSSDSNSHVFTALRLSPSRGFERVFGRRDGYGTDTEDALLNAEGFTLKSGTFHGDGSGLVNLPQTLTPSALPAPSAAYNGRLWYDGTHFWGCDGTAWKQLDN